MRLNLTGALGVLDVYHALESISDTSKKLFDEGSLAATTWTDTLHTMLLERGGDGFDERGQDTRDSFSANAPEHTRLEELRNGLGHHVSHLNYAERLREGRSIGSGQIEGACQNLIGRRLKQTAARWRVRRDPRSLACVPAAWPAASGMPTGANTPHETEIRSYTFGRATRTSTSDVPRSRGKRRHHESNKARHTRGP